jgi:hypothetical protein
MKLVVSRLLFVLAYIVIILSNISFKVSPSGEETNANRMISQEKFILEKSVNFFPSFANFDHLVTGPPPPPPVIDPCVSFPAGLRDDGRVVC